MATIPISFKALPEVKAAIDAKAITLGISKGQLLNDVWHRYAESVAIESPIAPPDELLYQCHRCADVHPDPSPTFQKICDCPACGKSSIHRIYQGPIE